MRIGSAGAVLVVVAAAFAAGRPAPCAAQDVRVEASPASWRARLAAVRRSAASSAATAAESLDKAKSPGTACAVRRILLLLEPENAAARAALGYERRPDGSWVRNEARRLDLAAAAVPEVEAPPAEARKRLLQTRKSAASSISALARDADEAARRADGTPDGAAWKECASSAWELVLAIEPRNADAHRVLRSPVIDGAAVSSWAAPFLEARKAREARIAKVMAEPAPAAAAEPVPWVVAALKASGSAASARIQVTTVHGAESARACAEAGEKAARLTEALCGLPPAVTRKLVRLRFGVVPSKAVADWVVANASGIDRERAEKNAKQFQSYYVGSSDVLLRRREPEQALEGVVQFTSRFLLGEIPGKAQTAWLREAVATDVTLRIVGRSTSSFRTSTDYADAKRDFEGGDDWGARAARLVEMDLDPPFAAIHGKELNALATADTLKAYGVWRHLAERDEARVQDFALRVARDGTEAALLAVFELTPDRLDADFRRWALATGPP
jgi:hypothetical protein